MRSFVFGFLLTLALWSSAPCGDLLQEQVSQREDIRLLQEKIDQLQTDFKALKDEVETRNAEISRLKADLAAARKSDEHLQKEIERIDGLLRKLDAAREQDRKTIVEEVGREINRLSPKGPSKSSSSSEKPSRPQTQEGVEHVVEKGQTLTAIAEAYGVSKKNIMKANNLTSAELRVGQKLFIPQDEKNAAKKH